MKRYWGHVLAGIAVSGVTCAVIPACVHDDSSFFIREVLLPPVQTTQGQGCVYTNDPTSPELFEGTLDVAVSGEGRDAYEGVFLLGNQIIPQGSTTAPATETSRVHAEGGVVRITDATGAQLTTFTTLGSGFVDPPSGTTPGFGIIALTIVDPATVENLRGSLAPFARRTVITYTKVFGTTLGGQHVESQEYEYPIVVCYGCLVSGLVGAPPSCPAMIPTTVNAPCFIGQDQPLDCHFCSDPICTGQAPQPVDSGTGG